MSASAPTGAAPRRATRGAELWAPVTIVAGLVLGVVELLLWPHPRSPAGGPGPGGMMAPPDVTVAFALFSSIDIALLVALVAVYLRTYRETRAQFALGLLVFLVVLLFEAVAGTPFLFAVFGLQPGNLGPFLLLGTILEMVALLIFLLLSLE